MRRIVFIGSLLICAFGKYGIAQTADITQGCEPLTVQFTAPGGTTTYFWDFGDGVTSPLQNPSNTFLDPGQYVVEFSESSGGPVIGDVTIDVYAAPVPTFTATPTEGCAPLNVSFEDVTVVGPGVNITGYSWLFGDGGSASTANPNYVYGVGGSFNVVLGITTNIPSCNVTLEYDDAIEVADNPTASFATTPAPATACNPPLDVSFTNNSTTGAGITYSWDFGNGNVSTNQNPGAQNYAANGDFVIVLTVTNDLGCDAVAQQQVSIGTPTTAFEIPDTVCIGTSIFMDNQSSAGFYAWEFAAGNIPVGSTVQNPLVTFNTEGLQDVTLTTTSFDGQCSSDLTVQILVEEPSAEFTSLPDYSCSAPLDVQYTPLNTGYETYSWIFGDSTTSDLVSPNYVYEGVDTLDYSINGATIYITELTIESSSGCTAAFTQEDTLWRPNALIFPDVADGCLPLTVTFSDSSTSNEDIVSWKWHMGDGTIINATDNSTQTVTYNVAGHFATYLVITNSAGCVDTSYSVITEVGDDLSPSFTVDQMQVCPGDEVQFTNTSPPTITDSVDVWHYYSETNRQFHCFDEQNSTWSYTNETGPMDVTLMVGFNGCYSTTTATNMIQVDGPIAELHFVCECDQPFDVEFSDSSHDATNILWDFGDGNTSTDADPTHTYATTGDFTVILTATNAGTGCPASYDTATVRIRDIQAEFQSDTLLCQDIPSSFNAGLSQDVFSDCWGGYTWQFDDSQMRPITTPDPDFPIPFTSTGDFEVTLIVTDINGCKDTITNNVAVHSINADFSASETNFCAPQEVDFTDLTTSDTTVTSWFWLLEFGFPPSISTDQNPTYTYNNFNSSFDVIMGVENAVGCVDADTLTITMYEPQINLSSTPFLANICVGDDVSFTASPVGGLSLSYDWDFIEGGATSTDQNPTHTFNTAGTYMVTLNYTEISSGCFGSESKTVIVQDYPIADFTTDILAPPIICSSTIVEFTDLSTSSSPYTAQWDLGNTTGTGSPVQSFYDVGGTYVVELIVNTNFGCADTITRQYEVINPAGEFIIDQNQICRGEMITFTITDTNDVTDYLWDFGDGTSATNQSPVPHTYTFVPPSGQTVAKLIITGPAGQCTAEFSRDIFIHEVVADFVRNSGDTAICYGLFPLENTSLNSDVFFWDFGDGTTSTNSDPGNYEFPGPGTYNITLGVLNTALGCNDTLMKTVVLHPYPELDAVGDTVCEGDAGNLSVLNIEPTATYAWSSVELIAAPTVAVTSSTPMFTAEYELTITDTNSCVTIDTTFIGVINPLVLADWDTIIVIGDSICMPIDAEAGLYIFDWAPTEGLDCDTCASPCLQPLELVTYEVQVIDVLNCFTAEAKYTIDIYPETFISFPTTFTPNGDDANDLIFVEGWGLKDLIEYRIFNRWGEELFFTQNVDEGWDGRYKGVLQNNDVYVYKVTALTWTDETKTLEGYFNLMR